MSPANSVEENLVGFIQERGPQFADVTVDTDLLESGLLDSLLLVDLIFFIEERYGLRVDAEFVAPATFRTLAGLANFVRTQIK